MKKAIKRNLLFAVAIITICAVVFALYLFNMPHRDVQATKTDYSLSSTAVVNEYLVNLQKANEKYLDEEGNSKILAITGRVFSISEDLKHQTVILLKDTADKAGVSCTFTSETNVNAKGLKIGDQVTIKGVIRAGAGYDKDLDLYENVIMEKCDILNNN